MLESKVVGGVFEEIALNSLFPLSDHIYRSDFDVSPSQCNQFTLESKLTLLSNLKKFTRIHIIEVKVTLTFKHHNLISPSLSPSVKKRTLNWEASENGCSVLVVVAVAYSTSLV